MTVAEVERILGEPLPDRVGINPERAKYVKAWTHAEYRERSLGQEAALKFLSIAKPPADGECIDFGCGTGRGGFMLALMGKLKVTMLDFAEGCLDPEVAEYVEQQRDRIDFIEHDLTRNLSVNAAYGFCCDVMEHIPEEDVDRVLRNILMAARYVYFEISTVDDIYGPMLLGEPMHLTVKPMSWWLKRLEDIGCLILFNEQAYDACRIYCTAWRTTEDIVKIGSVNVEEAILNEQVRTNIEGGWQQMMPFDKQQRELVLLAGGPSLNDSVDEIKALRADGAAIVTVNGTYNWALEHGMEPSLQIVMDARQFNSRFTKPVTPYTKYLIASQAHPDALAGLPKDRTWLWHSGISQENADLVIERTGTFFPIPGGSTVVMRAIPLLVIMGFSQIHLFGFDSCVKPMDAKVSGWPAPFTHHAYEQSENDGDPTMPVTTPDGKVFQCLPWMVAQATEFIGLIKFLGDQVELSVHGDGLIAHIVKTSASINSEE
jgi:SAM-dependent methyltransferase